MKNETISDDSGPLLPLAISPPWISVELKEADYYWRWPRVQHGLAPSVQVIKLKIVFWGSLQPLFNNFLLGLEWPLQLSGTSTILLQVRFYPVGSPSPHSTLAFSKNTGNGKHTIKYSWCMGTFWYRKSHPDSLVGKPGRFQVMIMMQHSSRTLHQVWYCLDCNSKRVGLRFHDVNFQGLNTGVLLLDLERMRNSSEYNHFTTQV